MTWLNCCLILTALYTSRAVFVPENGTCPRDGYAVSDISVTPDDSIFVKCLHDFSTSETSWLYCAPGSYMADVEQTFVPETSMPDYRTSITCCTTSALCPTPVCVFPRQPINKCSGLGNFKVDKHQGYVGGVASAYCNLTKVRSWRIQYCSCNTSEAELQNRFKFVSDQPSEDSRLSPLPQPLEQRGEHSSSSGSAGGIAAALGLGLPLALGLGLGLSAKGPANNCNITAILTASVALHLNSSYSSVAKSGQCEAIQCAEGYIPRGAYLLCCNKKIVSGDKPQCKPESCEVSFPNGSITGNSSTSGVISLIPSGSCAQFTCNTGMTPVKNALICCSLGVINNPVPSCTPKSCDVGPFSNGQVAGQFSGTISSSIVVSNGQCATFACNVGYLPKEQKAICCSEGQASATPPICILATPCSVQGPFVNGNITADTTTYTVAADAIVMVSGSCATFSCSVGHKPTEPSLVCCNNGAVTNVVPYCTKAQSCNIGALGSNTLLKNSSDAYTIQSGNSVEITSGRCITIFCKQGYLPQNSVTSCCYQGATTADQPLCTAALPCAINSFANGAVTGIFTGIGTSYTIASGNCATFRCNSNFYPTDDYYGCCQNGNFSVAVPLCYTNKSCSLGVLPAGALVYGQPQGTTAVATGTCVTIYCPSNYSPSQGSVTCCNNGALSAGTPTCLTSSPCPFSTNAIVSGDNIGYSINAGGCISTECLSGQLPNTVSIACCVNGAIDGVIPYCSTPSPCVVSFPAQVTGPTRIASGLPGNNCEWYDCATPGYAGTSTKICCEYGVQVGQLPVCTKDVAGTSCLINPSPNGEYTSRDMLQDSQCVTLSCNCGMVFTIGNQATLKICCFGGNLDNLPACKSGPPCVFTINDAANPTAPNVGVTVTVPAANCSAPGYFPIDTGTSPQAVFYLKCVGQTVFVDPTIKSGCGSYIFSTTIALNGGDMLYINPTEMKKFDGAPMDVCFRLCEQTAVCQGANNNPTDINSACSLKKTGFLTPTALTPVNTLRRNCPP